MQRGEAFLRVLAHPPRLRSDQSLLNRDSTLATADGPFSNPMWRNQVDDFGTACDDDLKPAAQGQLEEPAVDLHQDLLRRLVREDVLEEQDAQVADVSRALPADLVHGGWRERQFEVGFHRLARLEARFAVDGVEVEFTGEVRELHAHGSRLPQRGGGLAARLARLEQVAEHLRAVLGGRRSWRLGLHAACR